jgi:enoyl-CoA hydratase
MTFENIIYAVDGPVAIVTLNRPEKKNAQSRQLLEEMDAAFQQAVDDDAVRVIVLAGAGDTFSAGHDLSAQENAIRQQMSPGLTGRYKRVWDLYIEMGLRWRDLPKPTIAAVHGYAIFGGWMIATAMDLIMASEDAKFLASHFQYFSVPYDVGVRKAKELLFEFRFLHADEALKAGFINRVVPREQLMEETLALARRIAQNDPFALRLAKLSINQAQDQMGYSTFVKSALQTYVVSSEAGANATHQEEGQHRRRYASVDRALAYERERRDLGAAYTGGAPA